MVTTTKRPSMRMIHRHYWARNGHTDRPPVPFPEGMENNCYAVACALADLLGEGAYPVYGMFLGDDVRNPQRQFHRHGWVLYGEEIWDPTRWVFEGKDPYLHVTDEFDHLYDEAVSRFRGLTGRTVPSKEDRCGPLGSGDTFAFEWSETARQFLHGIFGDRDIDNLTMMEMHYLNNMNPVDIRPIIHELYPQVERHGQKVDIPIDFWSMFDRWAETGKIPMPA